MRKRKYYLYLTAEERRLIFNALLSLRNKLIAQGRYTDAVDELIIEIRKWHRNAAIRKTEEQGTNTLPLKV